MPGTDGREIAMERVVFDETLPMDGVEHWIGIGCAMGAVSNRLKAFYLHAVEDRRLYVLRGCASTFKSSPRSVRPVWKPSTRHGVSPSGTSSTRRPAGM